MSNITDVIAPLLALKNNKIERQRTLILSGVSLFQAKYAEFILQFSDEKDIIDLRKKIHTDIRASLHTDMYKIHSNLIQVYCRSFDKLIEEANLLLFPNSVEINLDIVYNKIKNMIKLLEEIKQRLNSIIVDLDCINRNNYSIDRILNQM